MSPASIKELFPELASQSDARVQLFLDQAARQLSSDTLGERYDDAQAYLTAHLMTMAQRNSVAFAAGASGAVASMTVGPLSRTFSSAGSAGYGSDLDVTTYGQEYQRILRLACLTPALAW